MSDMQTNTPIDLGQIFAAIKAQQPRREWIQEAASRHEKAYRDRLLEAANAKWGGQGAATSLPRDFLYLPFLPESKKPAENGFAELAVLGDKVVPQSIATYLDWDNAHGFPKHPNHFHTIQDVKRRVTALILAAGRVHAFPDGLHGDKAGNIAAAETEVAESGLLEENSRFDGAAYTLMLAALGADVPEERHQKAREASYGHFRLDEELAKKDIILKACLDDPQAFFFNLHKTVDGLNHELARGRNIPMRYSPEHG